MSSYALDRCWSDHFIPAIKQIVGPLLVVPATFELDTQEATDLIVLTARDLKIAVRIRRHQYVQDYANDFTFRLRRDSGATTEFTKIMQGFGDWFFYGFAAVGSTTELCRWSIIDLDRFRYRLLQIGYHDAWDCVAETKSNGDGTHFMKFDVRQFPTAVIASSHPVGAYSSREHDD